MFRRSRLGVVASLALVPLVAHAGRVARSELDYSSVQGGGSWFYGVLQGSDGGPPVYSAAAFQPFDVFEPDAGRWRPSEALVGSQNTLFLAIYRNGAHPCGLGPSGQDRIIWPTRRYVTTRDSVSVAFQYENWNSTEPTGRGITARVFVDGGEVVSYTIRDAFDPKRAAPIIVPTAGTIVDLALDPLGVAPYGTDSPYSARSDGTGLYVGVYDYPCSTSADCVDVSCIGGLCCNPAIHLCPDAGAPDDAGVRDAGAEPIDAGEPGDAGSEPPGASRLTVGCGCTSAVPGMGLLALALALRSRWRRRGRPPNGFGGSDCRQAGSGHERPPVMPSTASPAVFEGRFHFHCSETLTRASPIDGSRSAADDVAHGRGRAAVRGMGRSLRADERLVPAAPAARAR